jgi:hypothetical protein
MYENNVGMHTTEMTPPISATVQYFAHCGHDPIAALVVGRGKSGTVNLSLFPDKHWPLEEWFSNHKRDVPFVPQGTDPPKDREYCSYPSVESPTPSHITINVKE